MNDLVNARKTVAALLFQPATPEAAYTAGFDCGRNGASMTNCHFRYFASEPLKNAWENGKSAGDLARAALNGEVPRG